MPQTQKILVPIDFSEASKRAAVMAADLSRTMGGTVTLLHVHPERLSFYEDEAGDGAETMKARLNDALDDMAKELAGVDVQTALEEGRASDEIVRFAKRWHYDVIVLGSSGHGRIAQALLGSVTERVVRTSSVPVMVVPSPRKA